MRKMKIRGWNYVPDGYRGVLHFHDAPRFLKILALTPIIEPLAFPVAAKTGHIALIPLSRETDPRDGLNYGFSKVYAYIDDSDPWVNYAPLGNTKNLTKLGKIKLQILISILKRTRAGRAMLERF